MNKKKIYAIDFDGVLTVGGYKESDSTPNPEMIKKVNKLYYEGHTIIIHTGRSWGNASKLVVWLKINKVKYHGLSMEKLVADCYVDDRNCSL